MKKSLALMLALAMSLTMAFAGCGSEPAADTTQTPAENETKTEDTAADSSEPATEEKAPVSNTGYLPDETTLVWNIGADSKTYDPTLNSSVDGSCVINHTFEGLLRDKYDGNGIQPAIAAEMPTVVENEDGTVTYTFTLRDAKWSDGQPVTAQNFEFAWKRAANPATASEYAYIMAPIKNYNEISVGDMDVNELAVKALDDKTLEVVLYQPTAYFPELCTFPTYMPIREDIVGTDTEGTWAKDPAKAISNGPFVLTEFVMNDHAVFSKNENYWNKDSVKLERIIGKMIVDSGTALAGFKSNEIDVNDKIPTEEIPQLVASGECQIIPYIGTYFYVINQNTEIEALKNKDVRKAMSMAINRKQLVENVTRAGQTPASGFMPSGFTDPDGNDFREKAGSYYLKETAQVEEAKALLEQAGYPNGEGIPNLEVIYNTDDANKAIAEALQAMWKEIGINVEIKNQEWAVFQDTRQNCTYTAIARHGWIGDYQDPQTFLDMFMTGNVQSGCGYSNPAYDEQLRIGMSSSGKERYDAFYQAESILMDDSYILPLYYYVNPVNVSSRVQGWTRASTGQYWFGDITFA